MTAEIPGGGAEAVLLTGVYGVGKSSVAVDVVRLTAPIAEIERRLRADPTTSRATDLEEAYEQLDRAVGVGLEDLVVASDRPLREDATEVLERLGW